jgi:hypothetical protein
MHIYIYIYIYVYIQLVALLIKMASEASDGDSCTFPTFFNLYRFLWIVGKSSRVDLLQSAERIRA